MNYSFHPGAKEEFLEAIEFYQSCSAGLGLEFANEIYSTIQRIIQFPTAWSKFSENTRRCLTKRFPFGIIYQVLEKNDRGLTPFGRNWKAVRLSGSDQFDSLDLTPVYIRMLNYFSILNLLVGFHQPFSFKRRHFSEIIIPS